MFESLPVWMQPPVLYIWLVPLVLWSVLWKVMGLWKAGRNGQLGWFIGIFFINTLGILPLLYILFFQRDGRFKK
jgi:methionyl-tRNA synthetase